MTTAPPLGFVPIPRGVGQKLPLGLLSVLAMASAVPVTWFVVRQVQPTPAVHAAALFTHLVFVVVGFGAVLTVDWVGALWAVGRRSFDDVLAAGANVSVPIWIGFTGLVASGLFLEPDLGSTITQVKLALVFVAGWNGLAAGWLHARLAENPQPAHFSLAGSCATVSQACWWGALVIGHLNAQ